MRNVHKTVHTIIPTEVREERRTTRGYTYDPSEGLPSEYPFVQNGGVNNGNTSNGSNSTTTTTRTTTTTNRINNSSSNSNPFPSHNNSTVSTFPSISDRPFDFDDVDTNNSSTVSVHQGLFDQQGSDPGKFSVNVQLSDAIGPEDVKVSIKDHVMTIEAKKEQKSADGTSRVYHEFSRKFTLPPNVDMRAVRTMLSPQGDLKIEAPIPPPALKALPAPPQKSHKNTVTFKRERDVPIKIGFL